MGTQHVAIRPLIISLSRDRSDHRAAQPRAGGAGARSRDASIVDKHGGDSIELAAAASLLTTTHAHSYECLALLNKPDLIIYSNLPD